MRHHPGDMLISDDDDLDLEDSNVQVEVVESERAQMSLHGVDR